METEMNPAETLRLLPARARLVVYAVYAVLGALLVATQVGFAAAEVGQPIWLTVAWPVFGSLGTSFGLVALTNVQRDPGALPRYEYNEERKGNDMIDPRPAQPKESPPQGQPRTPVVVQDLPD